MEPHEWPKKGKGVGCGVIVSFGVALFAGLMIMLAVPVSQRLTAPVLCNGYETSVVTTTESMNVEGESSVSSRFYCIDKDKRAFPRPTFLAALVLGGALWFLFWIYVLVSRLTGRSTREAS